MNEEKINAIKNSLRKILQLVVERGEPLSDEMKEKVLEAIQYAKKRITELRQEDEMENQASEGIEEAENIIRNPEGQEGIGERSGVPITPEPIPELQPAPHESSNIDAFRYDPKTGKLYIKFLGKYPNRNGPIYSYEGVPENIFELIYTGAVGPKTSGKNRWHKWVKNILPSHGAAVARLIKSGGYPYKRLS